MQLVKSILKYVFAILFISAGSMHFINTEFFLKIMPPYLPWHIELVYASGVAEIALGVMLIIPKLQHLAAWGLVALLIAVFPANIYMATNPELFPEVSIKFLYIRLGIQGVLILWAYWYTRKKLKKIENKE